MRLGLATMNEYARSTLECGSSSYRLPPLGSYGSRTKARPRKAVAAATALKVPSVQLL
jgi:hypothetical protein